LQLPELYKAYINERECAEVLEHPHGFAIYKRVNADTAYLQDVFVEPEWRRTALGKKLLNDVVNICKKSNISTLLTSTDISAAGAEQSALAILHCGFKLSHLQENMIWYKMEIK
jgi:GNAT superfamily N-acetyltransferase